MKPAFASLALLAGLAACTRPPHLTSVPPWQHHTPPEPHHVAAAHPAEIHGTNTIIGRAAVIGEHGVVSTCAGNAATLIPATPEARTRMAKIYGPGHNFILAANAPSLKPNPKLDRLVRKELCDAQGRFRFTDVPDGAYFVTAGITGAHPGSARARVSVSGGVKRDVLLTN